ncbi:MAG: sigma-70 family RNA polymerase sigma factor [Pontiellaceae bacterium]|nr:sigma-70 family RNA polymerase sigma factor [Pontiellaceae bacterium]
MTTEEQTDQALVNASLAGNRDAFSQLVLRYQDSVFGLAVSMTRNHADAADMAQDAFVRAYTKLDQYNPQYCFRSWLLRICANRTKNLFRKRENRQRIEDEYQQEKNIRQEGTNPDYQELEIALAGLPPKLGVPLRLKYMEGMAYEEIAQVLGIGVSAAKMRVMRARNQLAEELNYEKA